MLCKCRQREELQGKRVESAEESALQSRLLFNSYQLPIINAFKRQEDTIDLTKLKRLISIPYQQFAGYSQQDAHEFLTDLLGHMDEEMIAAMVSGLNRQGAGKVAEDASDALFVSPVTITDVPKSAAKQQKPSVMNLEEEMFEEPSSLELQGLLPAAASASIVSSSSSSDATQASSKTSQWLQKLVKTITPTSFHFESMMEMRFECTSCGYQHEPRIEAYRDFSLHLAADQSSQAEYSIAQLVREFLQREERELNCPRCLEGKSVSITKRMVTMAPVIALHLKRFRYDMQASSYQKLRHPITFSTSLDLSQCGFVAAEDVSSIWSKCQAVNRGDFHRLWDQHHLDYASSSQAMISEMKALQDKVQMKSVRLADAPPRYELRAVVRHIGMDLNQGHYICDVRDKDSHASWIRCNDAIVTEIDEV